MKEIKDEDFTDEILEDLENKSKEDPLHEEPKVEPPGSDKYFLWALGGLLIIGVIFL